MSPPKVLLVGWDAADWKVIRPLMHAGKMPNVQRLVEGGASGQIATLYPPLSPMLWTSIATGKRPFKHGIHGFSEPTPGGQGVQPVTNLSRTTKALWNIFSQSGLRSIVVGWWPSHPAEPINGVMVSDHYSRAHGPLAERWPLPANAVHPLELAQTLAGLRVHPEQLVPEMVEPFVPLAREIDQDKDKRLSVCLRTIAECMSVQSAAAWLLEHEPWDFFAAYFDSIDHFCHGFMKYHPPRQSWIAPRDFELYHNVVAMGYQLHDRMLGCLLDQAGGEVTAVLISDHGFHPDHLRPAAIPNVPAGPAIEHRDLGVLAMCGPGIRKGAPLDGPSVLDMTPTILTLYGLPVGDDMDGKVLSPAFAEMPAISRIPSWDDVPGTDGRHPPHTRLAPVAAQDAMEQLAALGYIEAPGQNRAVAVEKTVRELRYNLGEAYQDAGRHIEAHQIFSGLRRAAPDDQRFAVRLFVSCQALGMHDEMRGIVDEMDAQRSPAQPATVVDYLKAQVWIAEKSYAQALAALERVMEAQPARPDLLLQTGDLLLHLGRWRAARQRYQDVLELDSDSVAAYIGLCRVELGRRRFQGAAQAALDAIARAYQVPLAHFLLGRALSGMKQYARAADAFRAALNLNPHFPEAHTRLAALLENHLGDPESAREHRRLAREMRNPRPVLLPESLVVVTGLPRSGTSMLMQMLAAGGMPVLADGLRMADEDNPRGYLEFEPVKRLLRDASFLAGARGKAVKIVAPLLAALPAELACRVILIERDLDEVLDSQARMLERRSHGPDAAPELRQRLREEYVSILERVKASLAVRPATQLLVIRHADAMRDPRGTAQRLNQFLDGGLDTEKMAAAIDRALYRNRAQ